MSRERYRFLHAGGLRLGVPLDGMDPVPDHLRAICLQAPYDAAQRVFALALREAVDFLILSGDVIDPRRGGPRAVAFLLDQLTRLHQQQIDVYWCGGVDDHFASWPSSVPLPPNVHIFPGDRVGSWVHRRGDAVLATIQGRSSARWEPIRPKEYTGDRARFTIAVGYGMGDESMSRHGGVDYWALGGASQASPLTPPAGANDRGEQRPSVVQYAGTCQGRRCDEAGVHGAILVEVDNGVIVRRELHATDVVRWHDERLSLPDDATSSALQRMLRERAQRLREAHPEHWLFVRWTLADGDQTTDTRSDQLAAHLRQGGLATELAGQLRSEFGMRDPGIWTVDLRAETPVQFPAGWYEEDTVLGDLLRSIQQYQKDPDKRVELEEFEAEHGLVPELIEALRITSAEDRAMVLRQVAALGVDLLRGDRVLSEELTTLVGWADPSSAR